MQVRLSKHAAHFHALSAPPVDGLLATMSRYKSDARISKIDLGVGVYRDEQGQCPIMRTVKTAEARLLAAQSSKSYLGVAGDQGFIDHIIWLSLGHIANENSNIVGVQTPGGAGALRLAAQLYADIRPFGTVWIGAPTWPNHEPIFRACGLVVKPHPYFDPAAGAIDFDAMMASLAHARAGDAILVHGCCHNPTGADLTPEQWIRLVQLIADKHLLPIVDLAYHGLGDGLGRDAAATRMVFAHCPEALLAYSCDKNFALYRERVGALIVQTASPAKSETVRASLLAHARLLWSMPPGHGAAIVRTILEDPVLHSEWKDELSAMRMRLFGLRMNLATMEPRLASVAEQRGLFFLMPLSDDQVDSLAQSGGIYVAPGGRANIAGLNASNIENFVRSIAVILD